MEEHKKHVVDLKEEDLNLLYYSGFNAKISQFMDTIYFIRLDLISSLVNIIIDSKTIEYGYKLLNEIRKRRWDIIEGIKDESPPLGKDIEDKYTMIDGEKLLCMPCYHYFFGPDELINTQVYPMKGIDKKKKKKKPKTKKKQVTIKDSKQESQITISDIHENLCQNEKQLDEVKLVTELELKEENKKTETNITIIDNSENVECDNIDNEINTPDDINKANEIEDSKNSSSETNPNLEEISKSIEDSDGNAKENDKSTKILDSNKNEIKQIEDKPLEENIKTKISNTHNNARKNIKTIKKTKRERKELIRQRNEYEEIKARAIEYYTTYTSTRIKDISKKTKKNKGKVDESNEFIILETSEAQSESKNKVEDANSKLVCHTRTNKTTAKKKNKSRKPEYKQDMPNNYYENEHDSYYSIEISEEAIKKLNIEIDTTISKLKIHNSAIYSLHIPIIKVIESAALEIFPCENIKDRIQGKLYGSVAMGLALEQSDIDITLENIISSTNEEYISNLLKLGDCLKSQYFVEDCKVIPTAHVPVIKLVVFCIFCRLSIQTNLDYLIQILA